MTVRRKRKGAVDGSQGSHYPSAGTWAFAHSSGVMTGF
jgi:hypothetical protein